MAMLGLDPEKMTSLAGRMKKEAGEIETAASRLDSSLRAVEWKGPDQKKFIGEWEGTHRKSLKDAVKLLQQASERISKEVQEQRSASGA